MNTLGLEHTFAESSLPESRHLVEGNQAVSWVVEQEVESKVGGRHSSWLTSCSGTGWTTGRRMKLGVPKRLLCCSGKGIHPLWPGGSVFPSEGKQAFLFRQLLLKRMVKHPTEQTERGMKLTRNQKKKKKSSSRLLLFKIYPGHASAHEVAENASSVHGFLRRRQCSGKGHILPKEKGHKREKPLFSSAFLRFWNVSSHRKEQFGMWAVTMEISSQGHLFEGAHGPTALNHYGDFRKLGFGSWFRQPSFEPTAAYVHSLEERAQGEHMCSLHTHTYIHIHTHTHTCTQHSIQPHLSSPCTSCAPFDMGQDFL